MSEPKKLTKRQSAVIEDLFTGELTEQAVLEKHHVRRHEYERWLADGRFTDQIELRIAHAHRLSRMILARHAIAAAARLVELTNCEKEEIARKASLDIIALPAPTGPNPRVEGSLDEESVVPTAGGLTPELAGRLLSILAQDRQDREAEGNS